MYTKFFNFVKYNNAFTILLALFFFGFGITFAANPSSVYSSQSTVVSVDNNWILTVDLDAYNFNLRINSIKDDEKNYYADYSYQTIVIENSVWQNKQMEKVLTISKDSLEGKDLGLFIAKELGENINYELSYLKKVQKMEIAKGESQKEIVTEYSGLIGKLLNPKEEVIAGYVPVIPEVVQEETNVENHPERVIVSTQYPEQVETNTTNIIENQTNATDTVPVVIEPTPEPVNASPAVDETVSSPTTEPAPIINVPKVQEVVDVLLESFTTTETEPTPDTANPSAQ